MRYNNQVAKIVSGLGERGVPVTDVDAASPADARIVMTMHRSKDMEFIQVVLYGLAADSLPASYKKLAPAGRRTLLRERSLLYVAATRAWDGLVVSWSGKPLELLKAV